MYNKNSRLTEIHRQQLGGSGFYRQLTWRRGDFSPRYGGASAGARRAGQRAYRWTKGGAAGRRVREQHMVCADFKGSREGAGFLGKARKGSDTEDGRGLARARGRTGWRNVATPVGSSVTVST
jgi:hypothetical protein